MPSHTPGGLGSNASNQPGAFPVLDGPPTVSELPTDADSGEPVGLMFIDLNDGVVKAASPDGSGGVATGTVVDLSASVSLGTGDGTGLL